MGSMNDSGKDKKRKKSEKPALKQKSADALKQKSADALKRKSEDALKQKSAHDIESIFAKKAAPSVEKPKSETMKKSQTKKSPHQDDDGFGDTRGLLKQRRPTTEEGYPIYSVEDMKIGRGGDTPDCPFDCDCCF